MVVAASVAVPFWLWYAGDAFASSRARAQGDDVTWGINHWPVHGATALTIGAAALLASFWPHGRRQLAVTSGLAGAVLGAASLAYPASAGATPPEAGPSAVIVWSVILGLLGARASARQLVRPTLSGRPTRRPRPADPRGHQLSRGPTARTSAAPAAPGGCSIGWAAVAVLEGEVDGARVRVLQQPACRPAAAWTRTSSTASASRASGVVAGGAEVLQPPQHVVVPAGRERELQPAGFDAPRRCSCGGTGAARAGTPRRGAAPPPTAGMPPVARSYASSPRAR